MGCGPSSPEDKRDAEISRNMRRVQSEDEKIIKLLLLGAGESGKSTIFKQMKKLYGAEPSPDEMTMVTTHVRDNILTFMKSLVDASAELAPEASFTDAHKATMDAVSMASAPNQLTVALAKQIKDLWMSPAMQTVWADRDKFQIIESHTTFVERAEEIASDSYTASFEDMLLVRSRTTGIRKEALKIESNLFHIYDVGGQKNERKKWIHCFENVTAIIFVVALSEFDQVLLEDPSVNRMADAITLFREISHNPFFAEKADRPATKILVFMNKHDLFLQKLKSGKQIKDVPEWSDYEDFAKIEERRLRENNIDPTPEVVGTNYFKAKFWGVAPNEGRGIDIKTTVAIDPRNVKSVWNVCKKAIIEHALFQLGA